MRRTKHRRRFHTDRIVRARRARYIRESRDRWWEEFPEWYAQRLSYGALASTDPWDCGRARCGLCRRPPGDRARDKRLWRADWGV